MGVLSVNHSASQRYPLYLAAISRNQHLMPEPQRPIQSRLFLLLALPPLLLGVLIYLLAYAYFDQVSENQKREFGASLAAQVADHFTQPVVDEDLLSLNVLASRLTKEPHIEFIAVYGEDNNLLAQAGRESTRTSSFTNEMTFQDSMVGFVRITITSSSANFITPVTIVIASGLIYLFLVWRLLDPLSHWLTQRTQKVRKSELSITDDPLSEEEEETEECILVVRIRPARYLDKYFDSFFGAAKLYHGVVEQTTPEELVIHFDSRDAMYMATCTGLLIKQLADSAKVNISFGGTLDVLSGDPEKQRKSASYLSSMADGELLVAGGGNLIQGRATLQSYHHSLLDSDNVFRVAELEDSEVLTSQAREFAVS